MLIMTAKLRIDRQAGTGSLLAPGMGGDVLIFKLSQAPAMP
jgi:hypothetical protein